MSWWRRLGRSRLLDVVATVIAAFSVARIALVLPARSSADDFAHYYIASRLLLQGTNPYGESLTPLYAQYGFMVDDPALPVMVPNPPAFVWLFSPLAALPPRPAFAVWLVIQVSSLAAVLWLTRRLLSEQLSRRGWRFVYAATIASLPVFWHFYFSQAQLLLTAIVLAAFAAHRAGRSTVACTAVMAAGLLKLFPLALLPWFVWRGSGTIRNRLIRAAVTLGFGLLVVLATGVDRWADFSRRQSPVVAANLVNRVFNDTVPSLVTNLGYASAGYAPSETAARWWLMAGMGSGLVLLAAAYVVCCRAGPGPELEFSLLCVTMLAASVTAWGHYLVFLIFPLTVVATRVKGNPVPHRLIWFAILLALLNNLGRYNFMLKEAWLTGHVWVKILLNYVPLYGLLGVGLFLTVEMFADGTRQKQ